MSLRSNVYILLFFSLFFASNVYAFEKDRLVSYRVSVFVDSLNTHSLDDVLKHHKEEFIYHARPNDINFGHRNFTVWVLIKITSPKVGVDYMMSIENAHLDSASLYYFSSGVLKKQIHTGDNLLFNSRSYNYNMFSFALPDSCDFFLLKARTKGTLSIPIAIRTIPDYIKYTNSSVFLWALYYGVLLVALVINLLLYFRVRESIYIYYVLFLIGNGVVYSTDSGLLFQFLWPQLPVLNNYVICFYSFSVFMLLFSQQILSLKKNSRVLNLIFKGCVFIILFAAFLNLLGYYRYVMEYLVYYFYAVALLYLVSGAYVYFVKKYKPAFYYLISWGTYILLILIYMLSLDGFISANFFTQNAMVFGSVFEIILLFLAVIDKIYEYRKEKDEAMSKSVALVEENRLLLFEQNVRLEHMVRQRTHELEELNYEVQAQNEELNASHEQLENQNGIINKQNLLLSEKKKKLEKLVDKRTLALESVNGKLVNRNKTLEQFGYFTAHNIRGPVSSIMGLINLFRFSKDNEQEQNKIISLLKQSSDRLDGVVKDMITLLDFNKSEVIACEPVSLSSLYLDTKEDFIGKLSEGGKDIDFIESLGTEVCLADAIVVAFVINQLLDNAYKFKDHHRRLIIEVKQVEEKEFMCFYIRDNGIGFDVERFESDVFGLYKKFHTSSFSGKGLGLYFIKEYMRRMNGDVTIEGTLGVGVTVKLSFLKPNAS